MFDGWHLHGNAVSFNDVGRFNGECNINGAPVSDMPARAGNGEILRSHGFSSPLIFSISIITGYRIFVKLKDCKNEIEIEIEMSIYVYKYDYYICIYYVNVK